MNNSEIAEGALRALPDKDHWLQSGWGRTKRICLMTAVRRGAQVDRVSQVPLDALEALSCVIQAEFPERYVQLSGYGRRARLRAAVVIFNDNDQTTYPDVRLVLEKLRGTDA